MTDDIESLKERDNLYRPRWGTIRWNSDDRHTVLPSVVDLEGRRFEFRFAGTQDDDARFAGRHTWMPQRKHDAELTEDQIGMWFPDQDIVWDKEEQ